MTAQDLPCISRSLDEPARVHRVSGRVRESRSASAFAADAGLDIEGYAASVSLECRRVGLALPQGRCSDSDRGRLRVRGSGGRWENPPILMVIVLACPAIHDGADGKTFCEVYQALEPIHPMVLRVGAKRR